MMAKPDPWDQFEIVDAGEVQPPQQAMGTGETAPVAPAEPAAPTGSDPFAQFSEANPAPLVEQPGYVETNIDAPAQVATQLSPEDRDTLVRMIQTGADASALRRYVASKGFAGPDNFDDVVSARDEGLGVNKDVQYKLPKPVEDDGAAGAFARGVADVGSFGLLDEAGAAIGAATGAGGEGGFVDRYGRILDQNRGAIDQDEAEHPYARIAGQLVGGFGLPSGAAGIAARATEEALVAGRSIQEAAAIGRRAATVRYAQEGAAAGGAYGVGSGDDLSGRLAGGAIGAAGGAAIGGALGGVAEAVGPRLDARAAASAAERAARPGAEVAQAAGRLEMDVLPADVGGPFLKRVTAAGAQAPLSASPIINASKRVLEQGKAARDRIAETVGSAVGAEEAGEAAKAGALSYIKASARAGGKLYDHAANLAGDATVDLVNARGVLDEQIARLEAVPGGGGGLGEAQAMREALEGNFSVQGVRDMRTELFVAPELRGTPGERRLKQVVNAASQDVIDSLNRQGRGDAAKAFERADANWKERLDTIDRVIRPIIGKDEGAKSGEEIVGALNRAAKGNNIRLERFVGALPPEEAQTVRASLIGAMGNRKAGAQDATGEGFSLDEFLTHWNTIGPRSKATIFGQEARAALNDLAKVAEGTKETGRYANRSNTTGGVLGNLGAWAGSLTLIEPTTAILGTAVQMGGGRLLASPAFARWLTRTPASPAGATAYIGRLTRIARAEPAIANDVLNLQRQLQQAFSPTRAAAEDERSPARPAPGPAGAAQ